VGINIKQGITSLKGGKDANKNKSGFGLTGKRGKRGMRGLRR